MARTLTVRVVGDATRNQPWLAAICATALISTFSDGVAKAATCTRVEAGKLPVKNSRRGCHTFSRWVISVTKIVTGTISAIVPPAASTRGRILVKIPFAWGDLSVRDRE